MRPDDQPPLTLRECYGIHWDPATGIPFLHEQDGGRAMSAAHAAHPSPFEVRKMPRGVTCPHRFGDPLHEDWSEHPLVVAMGAQQDAGLYYLEPEFQSWLVAMAVMVPAPRGLIEPFWFYTDTQIGRDLGQKLLATNAAPLIVTYDRWADFREIELLSKYRRLRNLIVSGPVRPPGATILTPEGLSFTTDWRLEGRRQFAAATRRF